jgi:hypothetical protein
MVSNVDVTKPTQGKAYTADVRNNFAVIKTEIETLQAQLAAIPPPVPPGETTGDFLPLAGGTLTGTLRLESNLGDATRQNLEIVSTSPDLPTPPMLKLYSSYGGGTMFAGPWGGLAIGSIDDGTGALAPGPWAFEIAGNDLLLNAPGFAGNIVRGQGGNQIVFNANSYGFFGANEFFVSTPAFRISGMPIIAQSDPNTLWNNNGVVNIGAGGSGSGGIPDAPADGLTYGRNNSAWLAIDTSGGGGLTQADADARYLQLTGGTLQGQLNVIGNMELRPSNAYPVIFMFLSVASEAQILSSTDGKTDFNIRFGSNQFAIVRYDAAGMIADRPIVIEKATGIIKMAFLPTVAPAVSGAIWRDPVTNALMVVP